MHRHLTLPRLVLSAATLLLLATTSLAQQVIQRGPFGRPTAVFDETGQWTSPLLMASDKDDKEVEIYIPDVTGTAWLKRNYTDFENRGQYVLSFYTFYRSPRACRANQIAWGLGDQAHLDACATDISYRLRRATVDTNLKTVTLIQAAMVDPDGVVDPASIQNRPLTRRWAELDPSTQTAIEKATELVTRQMAIYDRRQQSTR